MAITLTVTSKGQITLRKEVLAHLGVRPGDKLDVDLLSNGRLQVRSRRGTSVAAIFGMLGKPGPPPLSVEELNEVAASGWVGERC
jgi:AbrB family looped-hinge helix DNA binding protein